MVSSISYEKIISKRVILALTFALRAVLLFASLAFLLHQKWFPLFLSLLSVFLTFFPSILQRRFGVYLPTELEISVVLFVYASLFLGEIKAYYFKFWWWDLMLHSLSSIILGFAGFIIIFSLWRNSRIAVSPFMFSLFSFSFSVSIGALWEIFEFAMDFYFGTNMQKSGLVDTMTDLIVDALGALFVSLLAYLYVSNSKVPGFFERMVRNFIEKNPSLFGVSKSKRRRE
ncbi:hypothetical protein D6764_02620 [Candidatus Woesearchaeota archaeon]|nr:MAG: hypothetical protein D6764_02620 [Candidatus Woesearchaeota archaeon]